MNTKSHQKAVEKYNAANYERIYIRMRKADAAAFKKYLAGRSVNSFVNDAIREKIERERGDR